MRFLFLLITVAITQLLSAQQDTIRVSQLDQTIFFQPLIQHYLFNTHVRPINFFYSNTFKYRHKPFTGVAFEMHHGSAFTIELRNGRIQYLREFNGVNNKVAYVFYRIDRDTLLAIDSLFHSHLGGIEEHSSTLFKRNEQLRVTITTERGDISNGVYKSCFTGEECTDDGWSTFEQLDGICVSISHNYYRTEQTYVQGKLSGLTTTYFPNGKLASVFTLDEREEAEGPATEYWSNGKVMEEGIYTRSQKLGKWNYYDSAGVITKTEWYSFPVHAEGDNFVDSFMLYHSSGVRKRFSGEIWYHATCVTEDGKKYVDKEWSTRNVVINYYEDGSLYEKQVSDFRNCENDETVDTIYWCWYKTGRIRELRFSDNTGIEYYADGKIKRSGNMDYPRSGNLFLADSSGNVLLDRTYDKGQVLEKRDRLPWTSQVQIDFSSQLTGCAAAATMPRPFIELGGGKYFEYFYTRLPDWCNDKYIPGNVIDSLAISLAGVYLDIRDSMPDADSLLAFSKEFNPAPGEWYYTIEVLSSDPGRWQDSCYYGTLITDNSVFNHYMRNLSYEIISFRSATPVRSDAEVNTTTVIRTKQALNLIAFHKALLDCYENKVVIYCGRRAERRSTYFQVYRPCSGNPFGVCTDCNYVLVNVVDHHHDWSHFRYNAFSYAVNSDQSVDMMAAHFRDPSRLFEVKGW